MTPEQTIEQYIYELKGVRITVHPNARFLEPRLFKIAYSYAIKYFQDNQRN